MQKINNSKNSVKGNNSENSVNDNKEILYTIPSYYLPYLANGDVEYLTIEELNKILAFERQLRELSHKSICYSFGEESYFASYNDIDNLAGDVTEVLVSFL